MPHSDFDALSVEEAQKLISSNILVIPDHPLRRLNADLAGLSQLGDVDELRIFHGMLPLHHNLHELTLTIDYTAEVEGDPSSRHCRGSLRQFYWSSKIINGLDNPQTGFHPPPAQLATEMQAWAHFSRRQPSGFDIEVPNSEMLWSLAAKPFAFHPKHFDHSGAATAIHVHTGGKWAIVGVPGAKEDDCSCAEAFGEDLEEDMNTARGYRWFGILLVPGMLLYVVWL